MRGFALEVWLLLPPSNSSVERNPSEYQFKNRPSPICSKPLFQTEAKCDTIDQPRSQVLSPPWERGCTIDMNIIFYCDANKTHFYRKGFALGLVLKVKFWNSEMAYNYLSH